MLPLILFCSAYACVELTDGMEYGDRVLNSNLKDSDPDKADAQKLAKEKFNMQNTVYLKNLDYSLSEEELFNMCEDLVGKNCVYRLKIPLDKKTQEPRGFAHIEFKTQEAVELALSSLTGVEVFDRKLEATRMMPPPKISPAMLKREEEEAVRKRQEEEEKAFREGQNQGMEDNEKEDISSIFQDIMSDIDVSSLHNDNDDNDDKDVKDDQQIVMSQEKGRSEREREREEEMVV